MIILLTYYTAICVYYLFNEEIDPICENLSICFLHIFDLTMKSKYTSLLKGDLSKYLDEYS